MRKFLIRNDDVAFDTDINEIKQFCRICDKHGYQILHAVIPIVEAKRVKSKRMTNDQIMAASNRLFSENKEVLEYLKGRHDLIGVHGLWHTHIPTKEEIDAAKAKLQELGLNPTYFIPPFNEGDYPEEIAGLKTCKLSAKKGERLEEFLEKGTPVAPIMYLHSWRFNNSWYTFDRLEKCLQRLRKPMVKLNLGCKWRKLSGFDNLDKLMGGGFPPGYNFVLSGKIDTDKTVLTYLLINNHIKSGGKCLYIVTNRDTDSIKEELEELNLDYNKISKNLFFLDCFSAKAGNKKGTNIEDLNSVSAKLEAMRTQIGKENLIEVFDTVSDFFINNESKKVIKFLEAACARALKSKSIALFLLDQGAQEERDLIALESVTQGTVELENKEDMNRLRVSKLVGLQHDNRWVNYKIEANKILF